MAKAGRNERIHLGMVGGDRDAFIGAVHRIAARLDDQFELVAACFSSTAEKSIASGPIWGWPGIRFMATLLNGNKNNPLNCGSSRLENPSA